MPSRTEGSVYIFAHILYFKPKYFPMKRLEENPNVATEAAMATSSIVAMGLFCSVSEI